MDKNESETHQKTNKVSTANENLLVYKLMLRTLVPKLMLGNAGGDVKRPNGGMRKMTFFLATITAMQSVATCISKQSLGTMNLSYHISQ